MMTITRDQKVEVHPVADLFPQMADRDFEDLKADIERRGLDEPVVVDEDGCLIDGRHRLRACQELGMETRYVVLEGDEAAVLDKVVSANMLRRHLDDSQRAFVAAKLARRGKGRPKNGSIEPFFTMEEAAQRLSVSRTSVKRARKVVEQGVPELAAAVKGGEVPVSVAKEVADLPEDEQRALLAEGPSAVKARAAELRQARRVQARAKEVAPGSDEEAAVDTPAAVEASPVEQEESGDAEGPDDGAGADTVAAPVDVVDSVPAVDIELPLVTDRDRELMQYRLAPVEDAIDNLLDLPDPGVVAQLLHDRGHLNPDDAEKAAWWLGEMTVAYRRCVSVRSKRPART